VHYAKRLLQAFVFTCLIGASPQSFATAEVVLGGYVTSLYDIDSNNGTFSVDLWLWSKSQKSDRYDLFKTLEVGYLSGKFPHTYTGKNKDTIGSGIEYSQKKLSGTFLHDFDLRNFPYDRQILKVSLEDTEKTSDLLKFTADNQSGFDDSITIDGWKINSVKVYSHEKEYLTNFGNPRGEPSQKYSRIFLEIDIKRDASLIFFKVTVGLFAAILVALLSSFMPVNSDDIFSARIGLLGGTLLAVVVNQQFADAKSGETTVVTLVDLLHMLGFACVFTLFLGTIFSRYLSSKANRDGASRSIDLSMFVIVLVAFSGLSLYWIISAIQS
jgi:hypothetical protein